MRANIEKVFDLFLKECSEINFQGRWSEKRIESDWYILEVYLERPQLAIPDVILEVSARTGRKYKRLPWWLKDNGLYNLQERSRWVKSLQKMAEPLIALISTDNPRESEKTLQDFYEFCHRRYRTSSRDGKSWRVPADKKAFFMLFLKKLEEATPPLVSPSRLTQARQYLYQCQRGKADTLLYKFCRILLAEFDFTPSRTFLEEPGFRRERIAPDITAFDEEEVDRKKLQEEIELLRNQIEELWIEREQLPIRFQEYREEEEKKLLINFYNKLAENGLLSRLLAGMPLVYELTEQRFRGKISEEDYVFTVLRLFFRFLIEHNLRVVEVGPEPGELLTILPEERALYDFEGEVPDDNCKINGRLLHREVLVFGKTLLKPRVEIVPG